MCLSKNEELNLSARRRTNLAWPFLSLVDRIVKYKNEKREREQGSELALLVVRAFEVVQVLEGDLLEDGVDGLRVEALADVLQQGAVAMHDIMNQCSIFRSAS